MNQSRVISEMRSLRSRLTYANVMSTAAVFLALAGGTTAIAISVGKNSVTTKSIRPGNVTAKDLAGIRVVTRTASFGVLTASCPANERLLSGGANQEGDPEARFLGSYPDGNGWTARVLGSGLGARLTVYALCLKATAGP
jgi:hypothetical protein